MSWKISEINSIASTNNKKIRSWLEFFASSINSKNLVFSLISSFIGEVLLCSSVFSDSIIASSFFTFYIFRAGMWIGFNRLPEWPLLCTSVFRNRLAKCLKPSVMARIVIISWWAKSKKFLTRQPDFLQSAHVPLSSVGRVGFVNGRSSVQVR